MATLNNLVATVAKSTGIAEVSVKEVARRLRESRLIQTGKVGRYGGAQMTPYDAAALIVGLMAYRGSDASLDNLAAITRELLASISYKSGRKWRPGGWPRDLNLPLLSKLGQGHSLKNAVAALIVSAHRGDTEHIHPDDSVLQVYCASTPPYAVIGFEGSPEHPSETTRFELSYSRRGFPITTPTLTIIARLMLSTIEDIGNVLETGAAGGG